MDLIPPQLKLFHSELLAQLEQKLELDIKYLTVSVIAHIAFRHDSNISAFLYLSNSWLQVSLVSGLCRPLQLMSFVKTNTIFMNTTLGGALLSFFPSLSGDIKEVPEWTQV